MLETSDTLRMQSEIVRSRNCAEARKETVRMNTKVDEVEPILIAKREELVDMLHELSPDDSNAQSAIDYLFQLDEEGSGSNNSQLKWRSDFYEENLANCDPKETVYFAHRCFQDGDVDASIWFSRKAANRGDLDGMYVLALTILGRCEEGKYGIGSTTASMKITEGLHWLKKAADSGHVLSSETLHLPFIATLKAQQSKIGRIRRDVNI
jgi:hypothetical protein